MEGCIANMLFLPIMTVVPGGELHSSEVAYLLLTQQPRVHLSGNLSMFLLMFVRFIDGTAQNSGQRLDNVNRPHLVVASGN